MAGKRIKNNFRIYNVADILKMEERDRLKMTVTDKIADKITAFSGSNLFVILHLVWFGLWILINSGRITGMKIVDPFPFNFLTMTVSLEAIFLSTFVLISQNKQAKLADKRAKIDLQVNMIAERENTKLLNLILDIQEYLGMHKKRDPEIKELRRKTDIAKLASELDRAEQKRMGKKARLTSRSIGRDT